MDEPDSQIIGQLILIGCLTMLNAFFAAAEMALVSVNKNTLTQLALQGNKKAKKLQTLMNDPTNFLATIQVGITLAGFFSSASAATGLATYLANILGDIPYANKIAIVTITIVLSYITLVFGELFPKRIAMQHAEKIALSSVEPILFISKLAMPFVRFLSFSTKVLVKLLKVDTDESGEKVTREDIKILARVGKTEGIIDSDEFEMIKKVIELDETVIREIMIPRTSTFIIDVNMPAEEVVDVLLEENFSRIPVYEDDIDKIIGILHIKDFFAEARKIGFENVCIRNIIREAYFVPETRFVDDLLKDLQDTKNHLAILIDEYGGFSGIVTIEDLIEEIIGEIDDEHDELIEEDIVMIDKDTFMVNGMLLINEFNEYFHTNIAVPNLDTIGGFILHSIGIIPEKGKNPVVRYKEFLFTVEDIQSNRLEKVKVEVKKEDNHV